MKGILMIVGMSVGGWVGWELGALVSTFTAFVVSVVVTGHVRGQPVHAARSA